jgi:hypothetical protein
MIYWFQNHDISVNDQMCNPELFPVIKMGKPLLQIFKIDALLDGHGHDVLRLLRFNPDLNQIELNWAYVNIFLVC